MSAKDKDVEKQMKEVTDMITLLIGDMEMQKVDDLYIRVLKMIKEKLKEACGDVEG